MGNCLVTKLKSVVDNDNLNVIGQYKVGIGIFEDYVRSERVGFRIWTNGETVTAKAIGDNAKLWDLNSDTSKDRTEISGSNFNIRIVASSNVNIDKLVNIDNKYGINKILMGSNIAFDANELSTCQLIWFGGINRYTTLYYVTGNLSTLLRNSKSTIEQLQQYESQITGNVSDLYDCIALTTLSCDLSGDWYQFIQGQRTNNRTSGHINIYKKLNGNFNGHVISGISEGDDKAKYLEWDANKAVFYSLFVKKAYTVGYSDSEIATLIGTGGDWEGFTVEKCD